MKFIKKSTALILALLMVFGSFSMLSASAAGIYDWDVDSQFYRMQRNAEGYITDANGVVIADNTDTFYTIDGAEAGKYYDKDGNVAGEPVWVYTTNAVKGEKVKARVYIKTTGFALGNFSILHVYPTAALTADLTGYTETTGGYEVKTNTSSSDAQVSKLAGITLSGVGQTGKLNQMLLNSWEPIEGDYSDLSWTFVFMKFGNAGAVSSENTDWLYEMYFTVNELTDDLSGQVYVPAESVTHWDNPEIPTYVTALDNAGDGWNSGLGTFDDIDMLYNKPTLKDRDEDSTLGYKTTITFNAGDGAFKDGTDEKTVSTAVAPFTAVAGVEEPERAGFLFTGWTATYTESGKPYVEGEIASADIKAAHEDITYTANYIPSGKTVNVVINYTDAETGEPATTNKEFSTTVGNKVAIVAEKPAEPDENTTYILISDLPVVTHYQFDADNNTEANLALDKVLADEDAVLTVNYEPVDYTATFDPANGEAKTEITKAYYSDITVPAAPSADGKVFTGWSDGTETVQPDDTFKLKGDVTYTAQYDAAETTVTLYPTYLDAEQDGAEATEQEMTIDTFAGYTVKVVEVKPVALEENTTYVLYSELPTLTHYTFDANHENNELEVVAAADGSSELYAWYTVNNYKATFNPANGDENIVIEKPYYTEISTPAAPTAAAGQEFTGWKLDGTDTVIGAEKTFTLEGNVSYTAQYKASSYNVTYSYAGDVPEGAKAPEATTAKMNDTITLTAPEAVEGYTFKGWSVSGAEYNAETGVVTVGTTAVTITGTWAKNYTVTYEFAGSGDYPEKVPTSVSAPKAETVNKGDTVVVPENYTADGFNFIEWTVEGAAYDAATDSYIVGDGDVVVTGTWEALAYKYRYYLDDEKTVLYTTKTYTYGDEPAEIDVPDDDVLAAKGFAGWTAIEWDIDTPAEVTGDVDFVLIKEQYTYWVEFQNKDGEALALNNGEDYIEAFYGDKVDASMVTGNADVKGYTATGKWHINDADGEIATFPYTVTEDVTFIADYTTNKHSIIYYADEEGTKVHKSFELEYNEAFTADHVIASVEVEGYEFLGWSENIIVGDTMPDADIKIYPSFQINSYIITWVVEGTESTTEQNFGTSINKPEDPEKEGYTFKGWSLTENGAIVDVTTMTVPANNNTKFYAVFAGDDHVAYTVNKYFMNTSGTYEGVEAEPETLYGVAGENATYTPAAPEGFTFDATQANKLTGTIAGNGSLKLAVYYSRNKVSVTIGEKTEEKYYGEIIEEPTVTPEGDPGYSFKEWVYEDDKPVEFPVTVGTDPIVIKPSFEADTDTEYTIKTYTMGLDGEYGEAVITKGTGTTGEEATYTAPVIEGFTADKTSYTVVVKGDDSDVIEVYYSRNKNDLVYTVDGKADTTVPTYYGAAIDGTVQPKAIPAGFDFLGWSADPAATAPDTEFGTMGNAVTTLYAVLKAKTDVKYTVNKYFMNTDGNYEGVEADPETLYGETGDEVTYVPAAVEGFTFDATQANKLTGTVAGDGSLELTVYYSRNKVNVTINDKTEEKYYGETIDEPAAPAEPEGEEFVGWVDEDDQPVKFPVTVGTEDIVIKPDFEPIEYTVEFIVEGMDEAYATGKYAHGTTIVKPKDPDVAGFTFKGWSKTEGGEIVDPETMTVPVNGITFYAILEAKTNTKYTVKKFYMNETGTDWMAPVDDVRYGTTGATVTLDFAKEAAEGFTIDETNSSKSATIAGDGNTVLVIYYNRDKQNVTINGKTEEKFYGEVITTPDAPKAEPGYEFGGWVDEDDKPVEFPITVGTEDIVIKPVWNKVSYNLTFKDAKGNVISGPVKTEFDADITAPEVDDKEGYTFVGWIAEGSGEKFNGKMPAKDVVYVETWNDGNYVQYKLETYIMNVDGDYELSTWAYGSALTGSTQYIVAEALPGFSIDESKSVLSAVITGDGNTVLKAYYARNMYKVTFDGANEQQVYFGDALPVVEAAAQTGKTFDKWVVEGTTDAAPVTMPASDLALVSTWTDTEYTITYIVEGKIVATDKYIYGAAVTAPDAPEVEGKKFVEWSPKVPATMPAENLIISALFDSAIYKVTFVDFDGNAFVEMQVRAGDAIVLPVDEPTKEFYVFKGWLDVPAAMPAEDITIKPDFERVPVVLVPEEGSTTVIDRDNMVIYGLEIFLDEDLIDEYLDVEGDGYYTVTPVANGCYGTGTVIEVYDRLGDGTPLETFHIVIFGDLNGDARVNAVDAAMADDESLMLTDWSWKQVYENGQLVDNENYKVYMAMAADVNGKDGRINASDVSDIRDTSLGTVVINQVTGIVER